MSFLVQANASKAIDNTKLVSNGAVMRPNTLMMQELARRYYDEFLDRQDITHDIDVPRIYTVPKGRSDMSKSTLHGLTSI